MGGAEGAEEAPNVHNFEVKILELAVVAVK
jgi:hypothetical protein